MPRPHACLPLLLAVLAIATACTKKLTHVLLLSGPKTVEFRVTANGQAKGPFHGQDASLRVELGTFEQPPAIAVQALLPCGWTDVPVMMHVDGTETEQWHAAVAVQGKPVLGVWVDNRGGGPLKASLGQIELAIAPGFTGSLSLPAPSCEAGAKLRVGDAELAVARDTDPPQKDGHGYPAYLIDGSGARCYRTRIVSYSLTGLGPGFEPDTRLPPARLHPLLTNVDFLLKTAPKTLEMKLTERSWKHELTEVACAPGAK